MTEEHKEFTKRRFSRRGFLIKLLGIAAAVAAGGALWGLLKLQQKPKPAELQVYGLAVQSEEVEVGKPVQVNVGIANIGEEKGVFALTLKVDGTIVEVKEVTLEGEEKSFVTFNVSVDTEGTHEVEVNGLTVTFKATRPTLVIEAELREKFLKLLPEAAEFKSVVRDERVIYYEAYDKAGSLIGYTFITKAYGPSDGMEIVGIVNLDYRVEVIDVEPLPERPHLYNPLIGEADFEDQFIGLSVDELFLSPEGKIDAITGATISSKAVTDAIKEKIEEILKVRS